MLFRSHKVVQRSAVASDLLRVLPLSWTNPFENRHRILQQCRAAAEHPEVTLAQLDEVQRQAPLIPAHLGQTLMWLGQMTDEREEEALQSATAERLGGVTLPVSEADYALYRQHLLRLCIAEVIAPEMVAEMLKPEV